MSDSTSQAQDSLSKTLQDFVSSSANSTFTCGGSISLEEANRILLGHHDVSASQTASANGLRPVVIRWDRPNAAGEKICFPVTDENEGQFVAFRQDCSPAGFGYQGKDVYDDDVRKAWAMDSSAFSTNLCPYLLGMIDRITQLLLPNAKDVNSLHGVNIVRAELYKVNVYKGPSGFFKPHVDTPRAETQFASLVICLPCSHKGGSLSVTHGDSTVQYDWDGEDGIQQVQWTAFYSDCKHEVHPVTEGNRVTLTYNLYYTIPKPTLNIGLDHSPAPVTISQLAPYAMMKSLLQNPTWMDEGGQLGIYCSHAYPTTTSEVDDLDRRPREGESLENFQRRLSWSGKPSEFEHDVTDTIATLKGTDLSLFAAFTHLGLEVRLAPIITDMVALDDDYYEEDEREPYFPREGTFGQPGQVGMTQLITDECQDAADIPRVFGRYIKGVKWLNKPQWRDLALIHGNYYGNNAGGPGVGYAYMALLITVPKAQERLSPTE